MLKLALAALTLTATTAHAGSADIMIDCKSSTGRTRLFGYAPGDSTNFNITVKMDNAEINYVNEFQGETEVKKGGEVFVVHAMDKKVFTLAFAIHRDNGDLLPSGEFYAIPSTIVKTPGAYYKATYKAMYYGADPRSTDTIKTYVEAPIEMSCTQKYEI